MARWRVKVEYHSDLGTLDVDFQVDDLDEVTLLLSQGPSDRTIRLVQITPSVEADIMTIEAAAAEKKRVKKDKVK